jgi:hypothetical protein
MEGRLGTQGLLQFTEGRYPMATQTKKVPKLQQQAQNILSVLNEGVPTGVVTISVGGTAYKVAGLEAAIQGVDADYQGVQGAETVWHDKVKALQAKLPEYKALVTGATQALEQVYAGNTKALTTLGKKPKVRVQRTAEEKAIIAAKVQKTKQKNASSKPPKQASGKVVLYDQANGSTPPGPQATAEASNSASSTPPAGDVATGK